MVVVPSAAITASDPSDKDSLFEPTASKAYRHPTFYEVPDEVGGLVGGDAAGDAQQHLAARKPLTHGLTPRWRP